MRYKYYRNTRKFLEANGWKYDKDYSQDYGETVFIKNGSITVSLSPTYITLLDDSGDFKSIKLDKNTHYTFVGYFITYRILSLYCNYPDSRILL